MKIFLDCSLLSIGGGVQVGLSIIQNLCNDPKFEVIVAASPQIDQQLTNEIKSKFIAYQKCENVSMLNKVKQGKQLASFEDTYKPDLTFCVFGPVYWKPKAKFLQGFALPKMLYPESRQYYPSKLDKIKEEIIDFVKALFFKKNSEYIVVETEIFRLRLLQKFRFDPEKVFVIRNSYSPAFQKTISENSRNILPEHNQINIFVPGGYYRHKNYESLPKIAAELLKINKQKKFCFYLSLDPTSPGWLNVFKLAKELGVTDYIKTLGHILNSEIGKVYLRSHIIMSLSSAEASTAVYPEAMCAKRPLIISDTDFARASCEDAALYVDPFNPTEIAEKIFHLSNQPKLVLELVENGEKIFIKNYPDPAVKWKQQRELLIKLANTQ
jgi:glycosyltransferase involved in cell wall biosynthesis